jgi:hypothetical protein
LHTEARALLARGTDPLDARRGEKPQPAHTFAEVAEHYIRHEGAGRLYLPPYP